MEIYQFVHTLNYGDAISSEVIAISRLLTSAGIKNEIYASFAHEKVKHLTRHAENFSKEVGEQAGSGNRVILLHYSLGSPLNDVFLKLEGWKRVIVYHNLTPERWFRGYNRRVYNDLVEGRKELPRLLAVADMVLADSDYNRREIQDLGFQNAHVLPFLLDTEKWRVPANPGIGAVLQKHGGTNILHVGRVAPNKCIEDILKMFYFYHHKIEPNSRLWLIGIDIDTEIYSFELRQMISELILKKAVTFVGAVADSELRGFYENSDVYLCTSEHEGFCLPVIEAMHFGLPVIALKECAVGETVGDGGILITRKSPPKLAELVHLVITDQKLRADVIQRGKARTQTFVNEHFAKNFQSVLLDWLGDVSWGSEQPEQQTAETFGRTP